MFCFLKLLNNEIIYHNFDSLFFISPAVTIECNKNEIEIQVPGGRKSIAVESGERFIENNYHNYLLSEIIQSLAVGDVCLIGPRGSGKSMLINQIAKLLTQSIEPMVLYQDMTARDFVQQRTTTITGDTVWRDSPLIRAAKSGSIAILDGIHRIHSSTISILHRFVCTKIKIIILLMMCLSIHLFCD